MPALGLGFGAVGELEGGEKKAKEIRHSRRGGARRRRRRAAAEESPDLVVRYTSSDHYSGGNSSGVVAGGGSLLASAAGSSAGDRCSYGSDRDALVAFLHLAGREQNSGGPGPDLDPEKRAAPYPSFPFPDTLSPTPTPLHHHPSSKPLKEQKADLVQPQEEEAREEEVEEETLDPTKHYFSHALRECQNRRVRSEVHPSGRKSRRRRPASLDLNDQGADVAVLSPRFFVGGVGGMKKTSATSSRSRSGTFPSPGTPNYRYSAGAMGYQKGWSSERVPLPANSSRRNVGSGALLPFNNGRTLPSKWEDAEKWIFSPVSGDGFGRSSVPPPHHRRPKSKSGPLGPPGGIGRGFSSASPLVPYFDSGRVGHFAASSPFLAGVLVPERECCSNGNNGRSEVGGEGGGGTGRGSYSANAEPYILRSASVHGWSDALIESSSSLPSSQGTVQDDKLDRTRQESTMISSHVLKKDVATQMSPAGSTHSSPKERLSFSPSPSPSALPTEELKSHFSKLEIRDVQVDDRVTVTRWSKKHIARGSDRHSMNIVEWKKKTVEAQASSWEVGETAKCMSKCRREEAKITAWENLQKAKAEAEIRKLEMNLEKKRSSSMDKILNKLRSAQKKAQEMRSTVAVGQTNQVARTTKKVSYFRKAGQISSLSGCFTCHAF